LRGKNRTTTLLPIFLLGSEPDIISKNKVKQDTQTDGIAKKYSLDSSSKCLIRKDEDLLAINIHNKCGFVIFPYTLQRFAPLIYLAETKKPVIIVSEQETFQNALEAYDYLSDHENVQLVHSSQELETKIKALEAAKWLDNIKVCVFDAGRWELEGIAWQRNLLFQGKLNTQSVDVEKLLETCKNADQSEAERLAKRWMREAEVLEPSLDDIVKTAYIYLAMKSMMEEINANAAYVLWCGQFTKPLNAKMCFALAKLADDGIPVGCWRGGNLLPMLILSTVSKKPVFTPEALSHKGRTIALKHCFAPSKIGLCKYVLKRWRTMNGTVTGYCQLPKGKVTLANSSIGDRIVVTRGKVVDCRDLGGQMCRITVSVEVDKEEVIHKFVGREFAMVYGDYVEQAEQVARDLGLRIL
jgi:L-fucose isomerase-like protein